MRALIQLTSYKTVTELSSYVCLCEQIRQTVWLQLLPGRKLQYRQFFHNTKVVKNVLTVNHLRKSIKIQRRRQLYCFSKIGPYYRRARMLRLKSISRLSQCRALGSPRAACGLSFVLQTVPEKKKIFPCVQEKFFLTVLQIYSDV